MNATGEVTFQVTAGLAVSDVLQLYRSAGWWEEGDDESAIPDLLAGSWAVGAAFCDGRLIGMGRVLSDGRSDAYIQDVVVLPAHRGRGVGAGLVAFLRDRCLAGGLRWIGLVAQPGTEDFYRRLGFRPLEGHVAMRLDPGVRR